ncbi:MAG: NADH-quinone oxidoreductase subunit NuoE [Chloroflexi bacterium]|nr:NADH-quinone oxidoreductase subunit NuoE [Chloroflexota bacterium]
MLTESMNDKKISLTLIDAIVFKHNVQPGAVIPVLQEIQEEYGYIPPVTIQRIAHHLGIFASDIYGIVTFYSQFRLQPPGKNLIKVCHGTACHLGGAERLTEAISQHIGTTEGKTSKDGQFTLGRVACLGCCSLAPCVTVNGEIHGRLNPESIGKVVNKLKEEKTANVE